MISVGPRLAWLVLVVATLATGLLSRGGVSAKTASIAVVLIALFKMNLVITHFMEMQWRHQPFRQLLFGWLCLVGLIVLVGYLWY
jgi:uncharacterized membrane protein YtjA (UPF0391 family)